MTKRKATKRKATKRHRHVWRYVGEPAPFLGWPYWCKICGMTKFKRRHDGRITYQRPSGEA